MVSTAAQKLGSVGVYVWWYIWSYCLRLRPLEFNTWMYILKCRFAALGSVTARKLGSVGSLQDTICLSPTGSLLSPVRDVNIEDVMKARIPKRWAAPLSSSSCRVSDDYLRGFGLRLRKFWSTVWDARDEAIRLCENPDPTDYLRKYGIT